MVQTPSFEFPPDLRELAEKNIQQARAAYGQFMDAMAQAMGMWATAMAPNQVTTGCLREWYAALRVSRIAQEIELQ